jgi:hypothetical protein
MADIQDFLDLDGLVFLKGLLKDPVHPQGKGLIPAPFHNLLKGPARDKAEMLNPGAVEKNAGTIGNTPVLIKQYDDIGAVFQEQVQVFFLPGFLSHHRGAEPGPGLGGLLRPAYDPLHGLKLYMQAFELFLQNHVFFGEGRIPFFYSFIYG